MPQGYSSGSRIMASLSLRNRNGPPLFFYLWHNWHFMLLRFRSNVLGELFFLFENERIPPNVRFKGNENSSSFEGIFLLSSFSGPSSPFLHQSPSDEKHRTEERGRRPLLPSWLQHYCCHRSEQSPFIIAAYDKTEIFKRNFYREIKSKKENK